MNAKVTTWWKNGTAPITREMRESEVENYLKNLPRDILKGYVVDAAPEDTAKRSRYDIHTGDPVRIEHTLHYGLVKSEDGPGPEDRITVQMNDGNEVTAKRRLFVPMWTKKF